MKIQNLSSVTKKLKKYIKIIDLIFLLCYAVYEESTESLHEILQIRAFFPNALSEFMFFVPVLYDSEYDSKTNDTKTSVISVHYDRAERIYL